MSQMHRHTSARREWIHRWACDCNRHPWLDDIGANVAFPGEAAGRRCFPDSVLMRSLGRTPSRTWRARWWAFLLLHEVANGRWP